MAGQFQTHPLLFQQRSSLPTSPNPLPVYLLHLLPIKSQQNPKSENEIPKWVFTIKVVGFGVHDYKQHLSPTMLLVLYSLHIYLVLEIGLMLVKVLVFISIGCDLEPQFNEPYLASSLQDFWGRRWNLMVTAILRPAVFDPVQRIAGWKMNSDYARFLAVLVTFLVSGAVHELIFFYITHEMPTGEVTCFFVLHGVSAAAEVAVKKTGGGR
ncbi:unnamed protein product [Eruca vesicaria subsp. sativa]|uniref:Wax synthase domain-containing protein n=1 Tax=Eruca vesicaria subsp. sativa TaxID=29727 RepID=A0ABC8M3U5_ERUVS|nr:unnamed protein product [Eruca vesicaria subsp. sativa]